MKKFYRLNQHIQASQVRVVSEDGTQLGIMSTSAAIKKAVAEGKDLVEVAEKADPPVCKIIDFTKFKYNQQKKLAEDKKRSKDKSIKEIRLTPFIAKGDLDTRTKKAAAFLKNGHQVKITVKFVGRQMSRKEFGYSLMEKMVSKLSEISKPNGKAKFAGRQLSQLLKPTKVKK